MMHRRTRVFLLVAAILTTGALLLGGCGTSATPPGSGLQPTPNTGQPEASQPDSAQPNGVAPADMRTIKVFFIYGGSQTSLGKPTAVERQVPKADVSIRTALDELLKGPTAEERTAGYHSWFSEKTAGMVKGVSLHDGLAIVDFANFSGIIPSASSSAGSQELLGELGATVAQFTNVRQIEYRFDGSNKAFMEWLQMGPGAVSVDKYR